MSNSPWLSIWFHPKATIQRIVSVNPNRSLWLLATIYGFSSLLNLFQSISLGQAVEVFLILILALVIAPVWGYVIFSVWSWIVTWTGKWLKGKGEFKAVRSAYAWSCVPLVFTVAFWLILSVFFGRQLFINMPQEPLGQPQVTFLFFVLIAKVILAVWSLVIYINALAEVQQFSVLRAIGNLLISTILLIIVFAIFWTFWIHLFGSVTNNLPLVGYL